MCCFRCQLNTVGIFISKHMAGKFHNSHLHSQADPKVWDLMNSCILCRKDHSFCTTVSESSRNQDSIYRMESLIQIFFIEFFGVHPGDINLCTARDPAMLQCFHNTQVCIMKLCIFTNHGDFHSFIRVAEIFYHIFPVCKIWFAILQS